MMIKSMRDASGTDPIFRSDQQKMYQGMYDDQLSLELTRGRGSDWPTCWCTSCNG